MSDAKKSSSLPLIIAGVAVGAVVLHYAMKKRDPISGGTRDADASGTKTPGGILDGIIGGVKGVKDSLAGIRGLWGGGDARAEPINQGTADPFFSDGKDEAPSLENGKRQRGSSMPAYSRTWADDAVVGIYN